MPNWCDCELTVVTCDEDCNEDRNELVRFRNFARTAESVLDQNKFIPYPVSYRRMDEIANIVGY